MVVPAALPDPGNGHSAFAEWRRADRPGRSRSPPGRGTVPTGLT